MMKRILPLLFAAAVAAPALAQSVPFDMSPERRPADIRVLPLGLPVPQAPDAAAVVPEPPEPARLHLVPPAETLLSGEIALRRWSLYLNADSPHDAELHLGYQNSVMVAPEASRLRVSINGMAVAETAIQSPDRVSDFVVAIPDGVLRHGRNDIVLEASQRHRTDCTVDSTYALRTEIDPARTYLAFSDSDGPRLAHVEDIRGLPMDARGQARVAVAAPGLGEDATADNLVALAERIGLLAEMPQLSFTTSREIGEDFATAELAVAIGTADELATLGIDLPDEVGYLPVSRFVDDPVLGPILVVGGPTPQAVERALADWASIMHPRGGATETWPGTDIPLLASGGSIDFAAVGLRTEQFSGRRYAREFDVAVPADFYAQSYGEAKIMLDAAFARDVRPGSRIDVYVNDQITTTLPIMETGGGVLRQLPIRVGLREMRPGPNRIRLEAIMVTDADETCVAGTTASETPRFGLFSSSRLVMPRFARIAQRPDLSAFAAAAAPYGGAGGPVPLALDIRSPETVAASMTVASRLAAAAGKVIPLEVVAPETDLATRSALFVAPAARLAPAVLAQAGIAAPSESGWIADEAATAAAVPGNVDALEEWRASLENSPVRRRLRDLGETLQENFDLSLAALRLTPGKIEPYAPSEADTLLVAQASNPAGNGTWTVITAPDAAALGEGAAGVSEVRSWGALAGRLTVYSAVGGTMASLPALGVDLVPTQPWTIANVRLIAANWMSAHALAYSLLLAIACVLLGVVTLALLSLLGRRS
ncbi:cellulose biosynthesis cyclic di-GMP-binding regulatory protein BcsB [Rhodobacteraceae bacterium DSL-40]|uniref:cellulose biosynthesis cyclic di-GMP-binding regulatory protein BcsB n=1 Tax=Amaricoccus sp. B4 TaxID=3368557 RepID=UPI000DAF14D1